MGVKPCEDLAQGSLKALFGFLTVAHPWDHISCVLQEKGDPNPWHASAKHISPMPSFHNQNSHAPR